MDECTEPCAAVYDAAQQIIRNVRSRVDVIAFAMARAAEAERSSRAANTGVFMLIGVQYTYNEDVDGVDHFFCFLSRMYKPDLYVKYLSPRGWISTSRIDNSYSGSFTLSESWGCFPFDSPPKVAYELVDFNPSNADRKLFYNENFIASPYTTSWVRPGRRDRWIAFSWR